jgi:phosphate starvation-inducible PhoH-like protein
MEKGKENVNRSQIKNELKKELKEYNNKIQQKISIKKEDIEKSGIELTKKQHELFDMIKNNTLTVVQGPSGTAKTLTACYTALSLLANKKINKIIITKPLQESGESVGFLPGTLDLKVEPFMRSYITNFEKIIGKQAVEYMISSGEISIQPLAYMRGITFSDCIILLDEAQNCTMNQIMLWITRLGGGIDKLNAKAVLLGDVSQYDIKKKESKMSDFIEMIDGIENISSFKFNREDIVRNKMLIEIVDRYEKYKSEHPEN